MHYKDCPRLQKVMTWKISFWNKGGTTQRCGVRKRQVPFYFRVDFWKKLWTWHNWIDLRKKFLKEDTFWNNDKTVCGTIFFNLEHDANSAKWIQMRKSSLPWSHVLVQIICDSTLSKPWLEQRTNHQWSDGSQVFYDLSPPHFVIICLFWSCHILLKLTNVWCYN